jgi:anti-anti-sigma regulatory factor
MIDTQKTCRKQEGELILAGVPPRIYETLEMAGFVTLFRFYPNVAEAMVGLS